jgi:HD-GYP domain-containing protein (c-di-GMP phosphodiesterase class II)
MKPSLAFLGLALLLFTLAADATADEPVLRRRVLVLHSYGPDFSWTQDQHAGILSVLQSPQMQADYRVDYMDAKHQDSPEYRARLLDLYRNKYAGQRFDGVILTDNNALAFAAKHRAELFPEAIITASGINDQGSIPANAGDMNVILERVAHLETLEAALRQNPGTRKIYVLIDDTLSGQYIRKDFLEQTRSLAQRVDIEVLPAKPLASLIQFALERDKGEIIYLLVYFQDPTGRTFGPTEVPRAIAASSSVPVYVAWDFQLNTGVVGGCVLSGYGHGQKAAQTLQERLAGKRPPAVYDQSQGVSKPIFDYRALERFGISADTLPKDAVLLHKPQSYYEKHRQVILIAFGVIAILGVIIALLVQNVLKQHKINRSNARILTLNHEMMEMQVELLSTLGEVIETRSHETANHVRRVAAYSGLLGRKLGLKQEEIALLETMSPMHDVGKIGIPEAILNKPGKLTPDEHDMIKHHTVIGHKILHSSERKLIAGARDIALQHHERWDGSGYPCGLKGVEISMLARITALADVYDALSTERVYKKAWPTEQVLQYIREQSGSMFDPKLVDLLFANLDEIEAIKRRLADSTCNADGFCLSGPVPCPLRRS